jgi:pimeloyl-ACP methyl ester carboxylesterase
MLILWGDRDNFTPSDGPVGQFFKALPGRRAATSFVQLPGVGHCPMDEAPDAVHAELLPWLARNF